MKVYHVEINKEVHKTPKWDFYDSYVCIAKNHQQALSLHPGGDESPEVWAMENVIITKIGLATEREPRRVIESFNAG